MKLKPNKINQLAHLIAAYIINDENIACLKSKNEIRLLVKDVITKDLMLEDQIDSKTRMILQSYSRKIPEGSREWDILYQKTFEEEMEKRQQKE